MVRVFVDGDAADATGDGHDGTVQGAVLSTDVHGNPDQAYWFDGERAGVVHFLMKFPFCPVKD